MCNIQNILTTPYTEQTAHEIEQLTNMDIMSLFNQLGNEHSNDNYKIIMAIAKVLCQRNREAVNKLNFQETVDISRLLDKPVFSYVTFLRQLGPFRTAAIASYLFDKKNYFLFDKVLVNIKDWLDSDIDFSWKEKVLLTCCCMEEIGNRYQP